MKKIKFLVIMLMALVAVFALCACDVDKLSAPDRNTFDVSEDNLLTWDEVQDAYSYLIEIKNVETGKVVTKKPKKESQTLSDLEEGYYEIRIMSVARGDEYADSEWSDPIEFHKLYESGCVYTLNSTRTEYQITKVGKASGVVKIMATYRNKPVTSIANTAFRGSTRVEEVIFEDGGVTSIGDSAFYNCINLKKVTLPEGLTSLGAKAFNSCRNLEEINIPESLTYVPELAFAYCRSLANVELHSKITTIDEAAFKSCTSLTELTIPDSIVAMNTSVFAECSELATVNIGKGLSYLPADTFKGCVNLKTVNFSEETAMMAIDAGAFENCSSLETITLPETIEVIADYAFNGCTVMAEPVIPESVESIGYNAFFETEFVKTQIQEIGLAYADDWLVAISQLAAIGLTRVDGEVLKEGVVGIADYVFYDAGDQLSVFAPPASLKYVGMQSFGYCAGLKEVNFSEANVLKIGSAAFVGCSILNRLFLNEGLEYIGASAFYGCSQLSNRSDGSSWIPSSVTQIGAQAFMDTAIWNAPDESGIVYADNWIVGYNSEALGAVTVKDGTVGIADYSFVDCISLQAISNVDEVYIIGEGAFYGCSILGTIQLSDDLVEIKDYTFYKCTAMRSVGLPTRLKTIGRSAFYGCESLNEVDLSSSKIEEIGLYSFYGCTNLIILTLSEDMTEIPNYAFYKCSSLTSLVIPENIKKIGERAFYKCEALSSLKLEDGLETIGSRAFYGCSVLDKIDIPSSVTTIADYAFYKCALASAINLGEGVVSIGSYAFYGCESIKTLKIPASVTSIGSYAFKGASNVNTVMLPASLATVKAHSFYGWSNATIYTDAVIVSETNKAPEGWNLRWNSSNRPLVTGCTFSEDGSYVVSVKISAKSIQNVNEKNPMRAPVRLGYYFEGWATTSDAKVAEYKLEQIATLPEGTTVYAVWSKINN